jgi:hypothetical protein
MTDRYLSHPLTTASKAITLLDQEENGRTHFKDLSQLENKC